MNLISSLAGSRLFGGNPANEQDNSLQEVVVETLGREHSGKTGIKSMIFKITQDGPLPSGLELSAQDPRTLVRLMNDAIATYQGLQQAGFTSTIQPEQYQFHLFEADQIRAVLNLRESIGQLLTFTSEDSEKRMQEMFRKHHDNLAKAGVIHVHISCPADDRRESLDRLKNDLSVLMPNLRAAISARNPNQKVAVAAIVTKPDGAYTSPEEARAALPDDCLRGMLGRLVSLLEGSKQVGLAALFVTSAFGYGKARRLEIPSGQNGKSPAKGLSLLSQGEPEWILKEGEMPEPHNLTGLIWWSLMAGLALKKADHRGEELARTAKLLLDDLKAMQAWYVPLECRGAR